jgi:hypothetical protein
VSEYVTRFTQLSHYAPDNVDMDEKKQGWSLNVLNGGLAYALEAQNFLNFQDMVDKALDFENRRGIMERRRRGNTFELKEATRSSVMVIPLKDLPSVLVSRSDSPKRRLVVKDFKLLSGRFNTLTSRLLALHRHTA